MTPQRRRAVGIVRVSQTAGRAGESFTSPRTQRERIEADCEREGLVLVECFEEMDTSGGRTLAARPRLSEAVRMIEAGEADVIVAAYFDRLVRSLTTQAELLGRVQAAGGQVRAVDAGAISAGTSGEWLDSTMRGMMAEYQRRQGAERTHDAQADAIRRGVAPWPRITPGYCRAADRSLEVDEALAPVVRRAFGLRADGASIAVVRAHLAEHGVRVSWRGVQTFLQSRVVLGELHFGKYEPNLEAWPAIVDRATFDRVQAMVAPRGPRGASERLLARLGIMRCARCNGKMTVNRTRGVSWSYRCPSSRPECDERAAINAELIERHVVDEVREARTWTEGTASIDSAVQGAAIELEVAESALDSAFRAFAGFEDVPAARERFAELRAAVDAARARVDQFGASQRATLTLTAGWEWDDLTQDERRAIIRATVDTVTVGTGRGLDRVSVHLIADQREVERVLSGAARRLISERVTG
jgi:DNA invertase Pin-like site-specific DNA recombinase